MPEVPDERHRREAQDPAGEEHRDPGRVGQRGRDEQAVRDDDELPLRAQLECEVIRGRAGVERDRLALVDHLGCGAGDRALRLDLEAHPQIEAELRLALLQGTRAAADPRDEALTGQLPEIAPHRDLGDGKRLRKFRNLNVIPRLEQAQHMLHSLGLREVGEVDRVVDAATVRPLSVEVNTSGLAFETVRYRKHGRNVLKDQADSRHGRTPRAHETRRTRDRDARRGGTGTPGRDSTSTRGRAPPGPCTSGSPTPALVHRLTGCCPSVALHIPWDVVEDYGALRRYAESEGVRLGAINPNLFGVGRVPAGQPLQPERRHPRPGARALSRVHRDRARGGVADDQPLARGRDELPRPGRPRVEVRAADRRRWSSSTPSCPTR